MQWLCRADDSYISDHCEASTLPSLSHCGRVQLQQWSQDLELTPLQIISFSPPALPPLTILNVQMCILHSGNMKSWTFQNVPIKRTLFVPVNTLYNSRIRVYWGRCWWQVRPSYQKLQICSMEQTFGAWWGLYMFSLIMCQEGSFKFIQEIYPSSSSWTWKSLLR